jgi:hypothetical protein
MSLTERLVDGILRTIKLNDKVDSLGRQITEIIKDQRDHEQRLVRLETTLDLLTRGLRPIGASPRPESPATLEDKR